MTPVQHAMHIIENHGACNRTNDDGTTCTPDGCVFYEYCSPDTDLLEHAEIYVNEYTTEPPAPVATKDWSDPRTQAEAIRDRDGECPGFWECDYCALYPYLSDGDCYTENAYEAAADVLCDLEIEDQCGRCKSIW